MPSQEEIIENLKIGYDILDKRYSSEVERVHSVDEKLNMFLVFNPAILVLFSVLFPLPEFTKLRLIFFWIIFITLCVGIITTVILIILAMYPKKVININHEVLVNPNSYKCTTMEFLSKVMKAREQSIESFKKIIKRKNTLMKVSIILTVVNIFLIFTLILFTLI